MHPDLEHVVQLTDVDNELDRYVRELDVARHAVEQATAHETEAIRFRDAALAKLAAAQKAERVLIRKLDDYKAQKASALRILETGAGNPDSAERQMAQCAVIIDQTETEMLEILEQQDGLSAAVDEAEKKVAMAGAERALAERESPGRIQELEAKVKDFTFRRDAVKIMIPIEMRQRYDLIRAGKKKTVVAKIVDGTCSGCNRVVAPQQTSDVKRGLIEVCHGCARWLVV